MLRSPNDERERFLRFFFVRLSTGLREYAARVPRTDVVLASSPGGHLELLGEIEDGYRDSDHVVVTAATPQADALAARGHRVEPLGDPRRPRLAVVRAVPGSWRLARRLRPRLVICTGAGLMAPFCFAARALGARVVFVETMARVDTPSDSARVVSRIAECTLVQWEPLVSRLPRAELCRPALLEGVGDRRAPPGHGTFVSVGTHPTPFDRLLRSVDDASRAGILPRPLLAQIGPSSVRPAGDEVQATLTPTGVAERIERSAVVVCHAGAGIVSAALRAGRRPIVLPRRRRFGEHVDDHQVGMTAHMARLGLVISLDDHTMEEAVALAGEPPPVVSLPGMSLAERVRGLVATA